MMTGCSSFELTLQRNWAEKGLAQPESRKLQLLLQVCRTLSVTRHSNEERSGISDTTQEASWRWYWRRKGKRMLVETRQP